MPTTASRVADVRPTVTPRIKSVHVIGSDHLLVRFENDEGRMFDIRRYVEPGTVFEPLLDPAEFARVEIVNDGGGVAWACGADLSRDTLYLRGGIPPRIARDAE